MGTVYARGRWLWLGYRGADGKWVYLSSGLKVGQELEAKRRLRALEAEARKAAHVKATERFTLTVFGERWCQGRIDAGKWDAKHERGQLRRHAFARFGNLLLAEIRPSHLRELLGSMAAENLAGRTRSNLYGMLHRLFADAAADELIPGSPCVLRRGELPRRTDKNPLWRASAVFSRDEAQRLVSDAGIKQARRMVHGLALLAGLREGEVSALTWRTIELEAKPLGRLTVAASWNRHHRTVKAPKNGFPRDVPIHPTLHTMLAAWKLVYLRECGEEPKGDALVVPNSNGDHRSDQTILRDFKADQAALGLRHRRYHDCRRTFVSLALGDGARKDILRWVTHGPTGDVFDQYTTLPWPSLCEAVKCLRLELLEGRLLQSVPTKRGRRDAAE